MICTDPSKRHEFVVLFDVRDGNPNGDPDAGNLPRIDPETMLGLVTDVCLKRKIRDYAALVHKKPIFIQNEVALNKAVKDAFKKVGVDPVSIVLTEEETENEDLLKWLQSRPDLAVDGNQLFYQGEETLNQNRVKKLLMGSLDDESRNLRETLILLARRLAAAGQAQQRGISREDRQKAREVLCQEYYDIRMFGAVLSTGLNAGQVRGPVQLTFARSISPIAPLDLTITRQARTTSERMLKKGSTEMGRKPIVPYGLYRAHGFFNALLAAPIPRGTGVTEDDLILLWEALEHMFEHDRSAARGEMSMRGLWVFTHETDRGSAPAHRLFDLIRVQLKEEVKTARSFEDYEVTAPIEGALEAYGYPKVTLTCLVRP